MTTNPDVLRLARDHLNEMLVGFEIAADAESRIIQAYKPEEQRWSDGDRDGRLMRLMRNKLDAEANKRRFDKDANALRTVLDHLRQSEKGSTDE